ncbi:hypothetical protein Clacol_000237 [Clathrus columnatus]|uniref:Uncharacterized protein n=1 Tax=Clathrus columnatus TaxID=1419009 RepID=A0AAV4ZYL9_9AGAM|nr:hypothetical protein Clacol_000237 [Clathrus columnatus]
MTSLAWSSNIIQETFVLENTTGQALPLKFVATRICNPKSSKNGFTLVFIHGNGARKSMVYYYLGSNIILKKKTSQDKEAWFPAVQYIFQNIECLDIICAMWILDLPNHGDSASLNQVALENSRVDGTGRGLCTNELTTKDIKKEF